MTYATKYNIGSNQSTRTEETEAVVSAVGRVRRLDAKTKGRKRSTERQKEVSTDYGTGNGILGCTFLPKLAQSIDIQDCRETEREFYTSLSQLSEHYDLKPMTSKQYGYPYNISLSIWDIDKQLSKKINNWDGVELLEDSGHTFLTSTESFATNNTLFYIPVQPLFDMLHRRKRKYVSKLMTSVFTYLYHIVRIPYYRQEESYLFWQYEMIHDWLMEDEDEGAIEAYAKEIADTVSMGDYVESEIYNLRNLRVFCRRIQTFKPKDDFEKQCLKVAKEIYVIYEQYPQENIYRNAQHRFESSDDEENDIEENVVSMEKYLSFYGSSGGWVTQNLLELVNCELQEYGELEEPMIIRRFDGHKVKDGSLDFEARLFSVLHDLIDVLNDYKK